MLHVCFISISIIQEKDQLDLLCPSQYLQFGFARDDFNRSCGCLDRKCKSKVSKRTKKAIHKHSLELRSQMNSHAGLEPVDSSSVQNSISSPSSAMTGSGQTRTIESSCTPSPV